MSSCRPTITSSLNHTDERSPGQALAADDDAADAALEQTLTEMGAEGWELAAVLPIEHLPDPSGDYVVSKLRLFFRRLAVDQSSATTRDDHRVTVPTYSLEDRCGVRILLYTGCYAGLVVYCPDKWKGRNIQLSRAGGGFQIWYKSRIMTNANAAGTVTCAIYDNVKVSTAYDCDYEFFYMQLEPEGDEQTPRDGVSLYPGKIVEVDWRDKGDWKPHERKPRWDVTIVESE